MNENYIMADISASGDPAKAIVRSLGGPLKVAEGCKLTASAVCRWYSPRSTDCGLVPSRHIPTLIQLAKTQGQFLEPNMFFRGRL